MAGADKMAGAGGFALMDPQAFLLNQRWNGFVKTQLNSILRARSSWERPARVGSGQKWKQVVNPQSCRSLIYRAHDFSPRLVLVHPQAEPRPATRTSAGPSNARASSSSYAPKAVPWKKHGQPVALSRPMIRWCAGIYRGSYLPTSK